MERGERSFPRGDGRSPRRSGNMVPDTKGEGFDIFRENGTEERGGRLFWPSLKSATSKAAINLDSDSTGCGEKNRRSPRPRHTIGQQKEHIYRSAINMADELLQQVQELFEGQIVGPVQCPDSL